MTTPGWYKDSGQDGLARWHDGDRWTPHTVAMADYPNGSPPAPVETAPAVPAPPAARPTVQAPASVGFSFDGGAGTYLGTGILALLITIFSLGIAYPYALVLRQRWIAKHTMINGVRLQFTGSGVGLFGMWIKWFLLSVITLGIYLFWVVPRLRAWVVVHTEFDPACPRPDVFVIAGVPYHRAA